MKTFIQLTGYEVRWSDEIKPVVGALVDDFGGIGEGIKYICIDGSRFSPDDLRCYPDCLRLPDGRMFYGRKLYEGGGASRELKDCDFIKVERYRLHLYQGFSREAFLNNTDFEVIPVIGLYTCRDKHKVIASLDIHGRITEFKGQNLEALTHWNPCDAAIVLECPDGRYIDDHAFYETYESWKKSMLWRYEQAHKLRAYLETQQDVEADE